MTPEQKLLAILDEYNVLSIEDSKKSLDRIISSHCDVLNSIFEAKVGIEPWEVYIETLIIKMIYASKSIIDLSQGTTIKSLKTSIKSEIIDTPSIYILARSIIEAFLTLEYLYFNKLEKDEQRYRFRLYEISGLITRQSFKIRVIKDLNKKQESEKQRIDILKQEIYNSPFYSKLKSQQVWKLTNYGLPRYLSWSNLLDQSILKRDFLKDAYSLYSNYAHSEYLSMIQINESSYHKSEPSNISRIVLVLNIIRMINAATLFSTKERFKCAELVYNSLPEELILSIEFWNKIAKGE